MADKESSSEVSMKKFNFVWAFDFSPDETRRIILFLSFILIASSGSTTSVLYSNGEYILQGGCWKVVIQMVGQYVLNPRTLHFSDILNEKTILVPTYWAFNNDKTPVSRRRSFSRLRQNFTMKTHHFILAQLHSYSDHTQYSSDSP